MRSGATVRTRSDKVSTFTECEGSRRSDCPQATARRPEGENADDDLNSDRHFVGGPTTHGPYTLTTIIGGGLTSAMPAVRPAVRLHTLARPGRPGYEYVPAATSRPADLGQLSHLDSFSSLEETAQIELVRAARAYATGLWWSNEVMRT